MSLMILEQCIAPIWSYCTTRFCKWSTDAVSKSFIVRSCGYAVLSSDRNCSSAFFDIFNFFFDFAFLFGIFKNVAKGGGMITNGVSDMELPPPSAGGLFRWT